MFLSAVLGDRGALVLENLGLGDMVIRRSVVGWLRSISSANTIPGYGTAIVLSKSEGLYNGEIDNNPFENEPEERVAARILISIGAPVQKAEYSDLDFSRIGQTVDLLIKANNIKHLPPQVDDRIEISPHDKPTKAPQTKAKKPKLPRRSLPKMPQTLTRSELSIPCRVCKITQMGDSAPVGCWCVRGLFKSVKSEVSGDDFKLELNGWSPEDIDVFLNRVGK